MTRYSRGVPAALSFLLCALLLMAMPGAAGADTIRITLVVSRLVPVADGLRAEIQIRNEGDAPALSVSAKVHFRGQEVAGGRLDVLPASGGQTEALLVPVTDGLQRPGTWPVVVRVTYTDANRHAFEALHVDTVRIGPGQESPPLNVILSASLLEHGGRLGVTIRSSIQTRAKLTFVAPAGLSVQPHEAVVALGDATPSSFDATVTNTGATPGSQLPVFVIAERDGAEGHLTDVGKAMLDIAPRDETESGGRILKGLLVALLVTWLLMVAGVAWRRRTRPRDVA